MTQPPPIPNRPTVTPQDQLDKLALHVSWTYAATIPNPCSAITAQRRGKCEECDAMSLWGCISDPLLCGYHHALAAYRNPPWWRRAPGSHGHEHHTHDVRLPGLSSSGRCPQRPEASRPRVLPNRSSQPSSRRTGRLRHRLESGHPPRQRTQELPMSNFTTAAMNALNLRRDAATYALLDIADAIRAMAHKTSADWDRNRVAYWEPPAESLASYGLPSRWALGVIEPIPLDDPETPYSIPQRFVVGSRQAGKTAAVMQDLCTRAEKAEAERDDLEFRVQRANDLVAELRKHVDCQTRRAERVETERDEAAKLSHQYRNERDAILNDLRELNDAISRRVNPLPPHLPQVPAITNAHYLDMVEVRGIIARHTPEAGQ